MHKNLRITLGAVLLTFLVIQDSKGVLNVIELQIPRVGANQSTADQEEVYLIDRDSLLHSLIATRANEKEIQLTSIDFNGATNKKTQPEGGTDSEPESGAGYAKIENASNTSSTHRLDRENQGMERRKRRRDSVTFQSITKPELNNYVAQEGDVTPRILATHALEIHKTHGDRAQQGATIICFALMGTQGDSIYIKKFVTSNRELLNKMARNKAYELGYKVIRTQLSHAEGGMLQYLQEREPIHYTHLVGMGCSRLHCKECDVILKLALGTNYLTLTAAIDQSDNDTIKVRHDAVSSQVYNRFFIPDALKNLIENLAKVRINIQGERFSNPCAAQPSIIENKYNA